MDPLDSDTPSLGRSSLDRISQLRARPVPPPPSRSVAPWLISAVLLAFALGMIANPWFENRIRSQLPGFAAGTAASRSELDAARAALAAVEQRVAAIEARPQAPATPAAIGNATAGQLATRIGTTNTRVDAIGTQVAMLATRVDATAAATQASLASVARDAEAAQTVLLLGMTRRALESGARLALAVPGAESGLNARFGAAQPEAVAAVLALGTTPTTPRTLARDLLRLAPQLTGEIAAPDASWWDRLTDSLSGIVRVRETGSAATAPVDRVASAQAALALGNVDIAIAQIGALPVAKRQLAGSWLASAARLRTGLRGLGVLENAALQPVPPLAVPAAAVPAGVVATVAG